MSDFTSLVPATGEFGAKARRRLLCQPLSLTNSPLSLICTARRRRSIEESLEQGCVTDIHPRVETPALFFKRSTARLPHTRVVAKSPAAPVFQLNWHDELGLFGSFFCSKDIPL
jgi:hypothetical protein